MHGPGTIAAARDAAGFDTEPASGLLTAGTHLAAAQPPTVAGRVATSPASGTVVAVAARARELPCTADPDLFFAESPQDVEGAKALCRGCRVRAACLSGALDRREPWGVWGGELFLRGEIVPRKRPRGRPRKAEIAA